jgi:hypothetical protein
LHKSATKCNKTIGKWCKNMHGASKIIDMFETYHGDLNHVGKLMRSKHEVHGGEDNHLATAMDP